MFISILFLPLIKITQSKNLEDSPFFGQKYDKMPIWDYTRDYMKYGLECSFATTASSDDKWMNYGECNFAWLFILGYSGSLFVIQLTLNSIMHHKNTRKAQYVFAFMIPITLVSFALGSLSLDEIDPTNIKFSIFDFWGLILVGSGVFIANWFEEKP